MNPTITGQEFPPEFENSAAEQLADQYLEKYKAKIDIGEALPFDQPDIGGMGEALQKIALAQLKTVREMEAKRDEAVRRTVWSSTLSRCLATMASPHDEPDTIVQQAEAAALFADAALVQFDQRFSPSKNI